MALQRIGYNNLLADPALSIMPGNTLTGIYTELVYPKQYLFHPHHKPGVMPWRSVYQTIVVTDANNKIYFNDGSDRVVTIDGTNAAPKQYRMANYLAEVQSKLNASASVRTFTASYVDLGGGVYGVQIVADSSVTWQFNSTTGAFPNSIWATIGVDCTPGTSASTTVATSLTAQPAGVKSTFGRQIIKTSNDGIVVKLGAGGDVSFALTNGAFNCKTVAELMRVAVCDQLNITGFDMQWDESTKKFKWKNTSGSTVTLRATQAGFEAEDLLGITPGADFTITSGAGYVSATSVRRHTSEEIVIAASSGTIGSLDVICLHSNASSTATVKIQAHASNLGSETDDDWTGATFSDTLGYNTDTSTKRLAGTPASVFTDDSYASAPDLAYFRLEIEDKANVNADYVEISHLFGGGYTQIECHPSIGQQYGGETFTERRLVLWKSTFDLGYIGAADRTQLEEILDYCQNLADYPEGAIPMLWMMDLEDNQHVESRWVLLQNRPTFVDVDELGAQVSATISIVESR